MTAVQDGPTSITVTWTASSNANGYRIYYNSSEGDSGSVDVSGNNHTLTGLVRGATYTISIIATSQSLPTSPPITVKVQLCKINLSTISGICMFSYSVPPPGQVNVVVTAITATSISLSWSVVGGSVARSEVVWRKTDRATENSSGSLTGTSYTIDQLESTTIYTVTVRASNAAGIMTDSQPITFPTGWTATVSISQQEIPVDTLALLRRPSSTL